MATRPSPLRTSPRSVCAIAACCALLVALALPAAQGEWAETIPPITVESATVVTPAGPVVFDSHVDERARARVVLPRTSRSQPSRPVTPSTPKVSAPVPTAGPSSGTASLYLLDRLADCESGDGDGLDPLTYDMAAVNGPYRGPLQWAQRWWDSHVARMGRPDLVGANLHVVPYETQRAVTQAVPLSAWPKTFPACARTLGIAA